MVVVFNLVFDSVIKVAIKSQIWFSKEDLVYLHVNTSFIIFPSL